MPRFKRARRSTRQTVVVDRKGAARSAACKACNGYIAKDEIVDYVRWRPNVPGVRGVGVTLMFHTHCTPSPSTFDASYTPGAASAPAAAAPVTAPIPTKPQTPNELAFAALATLEQALVARAKASGVTPDMEKAFARYNKLKALALRPATPGEEAAALRMAVLDAVKMVF